MRKNSLARPKKVYTQWVGLDGIWILPQITQNPFQLARDIQIVLRTTQSRLWLAIQAANYRGNYNRIKGSLSLEVPSFVLVEFPLEFIVNLPRRKTRFWFINHGSRPLQFVGRRTVLSTVLAWFTFQANQHIFGPGQAQVRRECVETVTQVSYLTSQCQWNVRILSVILCGASCFKRFP